MPRRHDPLGLIEELDRYGNRIEVDDPEFEAKVRARIGAPYVGEVDKNVAHGFPKIYRDSLGVNAGDIPIDERRSAIRHDFGLAALQNYPDPSKYVLGFGEGASPRTYAHEFRHNKIDDEIKNRIADLQASTTGYQYASNIQSLYEALYQDQGKELPFEVREKRVLKYIPNSQLEFLTTERHKNINRGEQGELREFMSHPIDYVKGERYEDPYKQAATKLTKGTMQERAELPYLSFVGRTDLPDPLFAEEKGVYRRAYGTNADTAKALVDAIKKSESKQKKAAGGAIENTTHYRKMI